MRRYSVPVVPPSFRASGDRWLFGYADVVTLLFACFASLYAAKVVPAASQHSDLALPVEAPSRRVPTSSSLERDLQDIAEANAGLTFEVSESTRGLVLSLAEAGSFPPGRADLTAGARQAMLTVAAALARIPNLIRVEGHTDDTPIQTELFASNWELSTARATRVVQLMSGLGGLDPSRLSAAGYAEFRPRVPNSSPEARARNRRVDIVVLDVTAATAEPAVAGP